jgi:gamma-glutamyltranspeptidase/glutathione hydrolase
MTKDGKPWDQLRRDGRRDAAAGARADRDVNLIDFGMNLQEAGDAPRMHHDGSTEPVYHGASESRKDGQAAGY